MFRIINVNVGWHKIQSFNKGDLPFDKRLLFIVTFALIFFVWRVTIVYNQNGPNHL